MEKKSQIGFTKLLVTGFFLMLILSIYFIVAEEPESIEKQSNLIGKFCDLEVNGNSVRDTTCLNYTMNDGENPADFKVEGREVGFAVGVDSNDYRLTSPVLRKLEGGKYDTFLADYGVEGYELTQSINFTDSKEVPIKIFHSIKNTNPSAIDDVIFYYVFDLFNDDIIELNGSLCSKTGTGNEKWICINQDEIETLSNGTNVTTNYIDRPVVNFNAEYDFRYDDLIENGFNLTDIRLVQNKNKLWVGFSLVDKTIASGQTIELDPTFSSNDIESIDIIPLDTNKVVIGVCDETTDWAYAYIYYTNGTVINTINVQDRGTCDLDDGLQALTSLNETLWVYTYFDEDADDILFAVYDNLGNLITSPVTVDGAVGTDGRVDVDAINDTHFNLAYFDDAVNDIFYAQYTYKGVEVIAPVTDSDMNNERDADTVAITTLNETTAIIVWFDDVGDEYSFKRVNGGVLSSQTQIEAIVSGDQVSITSFNQTRFVISYYKQGDDDMGYAIYDYPDTLIINAVSDSAVGTASGDVSEDITIINETHFVQLWYDDGDGDTTFVVDNSAGGSFSGPIDADQDTAIKGSGVASETQSSGIGICDDNLAIAFIKASNNAMWSAWYPNGTAWGGECFVPVAIVEWNQSSLDLGESVNNITTVLKITSTLSNNNVIVDCMGNCTEITTNWTQRTMSDGQVDNVLITCSNTTEGIFNATFNVTSDDDSSSNLLNVICEVFSYGTLEVNLTSPFDDFNLTQNETFLLNATVTCSGGANTRCGEISAFVRYNESSVVPNTDINVTVDTPFYIMGGGAGINYTNWRPIGEDGNFFEPFKAYDGDWNDTSSYVFVDGTTLVQAGVHVYNFDSGEFEGLLDFTSDSELTNKTRFYNENFINGSGYVIIRAFEDDDFSPDVFHNFTFKIGEQQLSFKIRVSAKAVDDDFFLYDLYITTNETEGTSSNPITSDDLNVGDSYNFSWVVNATGTNNQAWELGIFFNSSLGDALVSNNHTKNVTVCIGSCGGGVSDTIPIYSTNSTNGTTVDTAILHSLSWEDDIGLSGYIFSFRNGDLNSGNYLETNIFQLTVTGAGAISDVSWDAQSFNYTSDFLLSKIKQRFSSGAGNPSCNITMRIRQNNIIDNKPMEIIYNSITSLDSSDMSAGWHEFDFLNVSLNGTQTYWLSIEGENEGCDGLNFRSVMWNTTTSSYPGGMNSATINAGDSWVLHSDTDHTFEMVIYSNPFINDTWVAMEGTSNISTATKHINVTAGVNYYWCVYANDSSNNWNSTSCINPFFYTSTSTSDTCSPTSPLTSNHLFDCADNCIQSTNLDAGGFNISVIGTGTFVINEANITNFKKITIKGTDSSNICKVTCKNGCFR